MSIILCRLVVAHRCTPRTTASCGRAELRRRVLDQTLEVGRELFGAVSVDDLCQREAIAQPLALRIANDGPRFEKQRGDVRARQDKDDVALYALSKRRGLPG